MQQRKLYATGFPKFTTERDINDLFNSFGKVNRVLYTLNPRDMTFRGFCYIVMDSLSDFQYLKDLASIQFKGNRISIQAAKSLKEVNNIRINATELAIQDIIKPAGTKKYSPNNNFKPPTLTRGYESNNTQNPSSIEDPFFFIQHGGDSIKNSF